MASNSKEESRKFHNHSEIFAIIMKMSKLSFRYIAKFRYAAKITYGCSPCEDKIGNSEVSKKKKIFSHTKILLKKFCLFYFILLFLLLFKTICYFF